METYASNRKRLEAQAQEAAQALPRDLAAALAKRDWSEYLRDRYDVDALVAKLDELRRERGFIEEIRAAGDCNRAAQSGRRGRPRKQTQTVPALAKK